MTKLQRFFFLFSVFCLGYSLTPVVHAETIAATQQGRTWKRWASDPSPTVYSAKALEACNVSRAANLPAWTVVAVLTAEPATATTVNVFASVRRNSDGLMDVLGCEMLYAYGPAYVCPSTGGWTLSGSGASSICTRADCGPGQERDSNGVCVSQCGTDGASWDGTKCACPGLQSFTVATKTCACETGGRLKGTSISGTGSVPSTTCYSNCTATVGGLSVSSGGVWAAELGSFSGAKCATTTPNTKTPTTDTRTPAEKCLASGGGYITTSSGTVCTSVSDSPQPITTSKVSDVVNKDAAGVVTGSTTTTTECVGTQCTTTTTTKDATGAVVGSSTTTGTPEGTGEGGGGDGDTDECTLHPERVGCAELGTPEGTDELENVTRGVESVTQQSFSASNSCPSDIPLPKGSALSFSYPCQLATSLRPLLLALAWLAAGFMVMGVFRDG